MERINDSASLDLLRRANSCFGRFFAQFSGAPAAGSDDELRALLQLHEMLEAVGAVLDGRLQATAGQDTREALGCYRENLIHLQRELAVMEESVISRRARLDSRREHPYGAKDWYVVSRTIN